MVRILFTALEDTALPREFKETSFFQSVIIAEDIRCKCAQRVQRNFIFQSVIFAEDVRCKCTQRVQKNFIFQSVTFTEDIHCQYASLSMIYSIYDSYQLLVLFTIRFFEVAMLKGIALLGETPGVIV